MVHSQIQRLDSFDRIQKLVRNFGNILSSGGGGGAGSEMEGTGRGGTIDRR